MPKDGSVAVYVDNQLLVRFNSTPITAGLPQLQPGTHSLAVSVQDYSEEVLAESEVDFHIRLHIKTPPLWDFAGGFPRILEPAKPSDLWNRAELTVIWTCPDWEIDWISSLLRKSGIRFSIVFDPDLRILAPNAMIALSQNDERNRTPDQLASYILRFRENGFRVGVLHMSDEDYTALVYFYPRVHYVIRNHYQSDLALLPHVLAIPLGYKKGFHNVSSSPEEREAHFPPQTDKKRQYLWNFVGQTHDKPTRQAMLTAAKTIPNGFTLLTHYWNDPTGLSTAEYRRVLEDSAFTLCPRGFVHPESFRLWEALESGSVPIIEGDEYFDALLGAGHPLPSLPQPKDCPRPSTTIHRPLPYPPLECADVWPALPDAMARLIPMHLKLQQETYSWWQHFRRNVTERVAAVIRHGAGWQAQMEFGLGAVTSPDGPSNESPGDPNVTVVLSRGGGGQRAPLWGLKARSDKIVVQDEARAKNQGSHSDPKGQARSPRNSPVGTSHAPGEGLEPAVQGSSKNECNHHDLRCRAEEAANMPDKESHQALHSSISEAKAMAGALFSRRPTLEHTNSTGPLRDHDEAYMAELDRRRHETEDESDTTLSTVEEDPGTVDQDGVYQVGRYPNGPCESDCDCPGAQACVEGSCTTAVEGLCPSKGAGAAALRRFGAVLVVNMNATELDRERWRRSVAQLRKYGIAFERFEGVRGADLGSAQVSGLSLPSCCDPSVPSCPCPVAVAPPCLLVPALW